MLARDQPAPLDASQRRNCAAPYDGPRDLATELLHAVLVTRPDGSAYVESAWRSSVDAGKRRMDLHLKRVDDDGTRYTLVMLAAPVWARVTARVVESARSGGGAS